MPPAVFALAAGRLVFAAFRRERGGFALREIQSVPLKPGTFTAGPLGGPLADPGAFEVALESLLERLQARPKRASLILPDAWARALVIELGALPERAELRLEVLRFRLKRLVPYRVEELRIVATPIAPIPGQEDPVRALAVFAADGLCTALERAFHAHGIAIGQITNATLARLEALEVTGRLAGLTALASVESGGFTIVFANDGEPVLWRQKSFSDELDDADQATMLEAELRLTSTFLGERLRGERPTVVFLDAEPTIVPYWTSILSAGLERPVVTLEAGHLPLVGELPEAPAGELAALAGGVAREVA